MSEPEHISAEEQRAASERLLGSLLSTPQRVSLYRQSAQFRYEVDLLVTSTLPDILEGMVRRANAHMQMQAQFEHLVRERKAGPNLVLPLIEDTSP